MNFNQSLQAIAASLALMTVVEPAAAQSKTDIATAASRCTANCNDAGYAWAKANGASEAADCETSNEDFGAGCRNYVLETMPAVPAEGEEGAATAEDVWADEAASSTGDTAQADEAIDSVEPDDGGDLPQG
jgi:hypothetical protein